MTNPQHEALVEAVARAIAANHIQFGAEDAVGKVMLEHSWQNYKGDAIAALSATAATPSDEVVRLRAALREIADGTVIALECGDTWPSPLGAKASQQIARAALELQAKDL